MMAYKKIDIEIQKLISKNKGQFLDNGVHRVSSILLFKDYTRRIVTWKKELLDIHGGVNRAGDKFNNLFLDIKPDWLNEIMTIDEFVNYMENKYKLKLFGGRNGGNTFIYLFIYWEVYKDSIDIRKYNYLEHPYEGIIKIILHNNMIYRGRDVLICNVPIYDNQVFKLPSIEDDFLNFIDANCKLDGYNGIPNQEKTNQLYKEFLKLKTAIK